MKKKTYIIIFVSLLTMLGAVVYFQHLSRQVAEEEQERMAIWAEATERLILADETEDIDFYSTIIERNTSIPVYMTDSTGEVLLCRNVTHPKNPTSLHGPIEVQIDEDNIQYLYYDDSRLLHELRYYPMVMLAIITVFVIILILIVYTEQRAEQNRVWIGLCKETAHQLGTPISSLNAWMELLQSSYPDDKMLPELKKDIARLENISNRFGKVGSEPELHRAELDKIVDETVLYMQNRLGNRIQVLFDTEAANCTTMLCEPLFSWVLENLIKNAADASATEIHLQLREDGNKLLLDVHDNGKGIREPRKIFTPGYTTKKRGWGLGLSLARRIIEQYHNGSIVLLETGPEKGSTFRISLQK